MTENKKTTFDTVQEQLNFIQKELKAPKNQRNNFGGYNYRSCEDIVEAVKPLLGNCTLTMSDEIVHFSSTSTPTVVTLVDSKGKTYTEIIGGDRYYVKATVALSNGKEEKTVSALAREEENKKGMDGSQITGAASSYARKYALNGLFAIDDTQDADSTNTGSKPQAVSSSRPQSAQQSQQSQTQIMQEFGMDVNQKTPKCPKCGADMRLTKRKDGSGIFWMCPNWRTNQCKGINVDDVDIDGNVIK